MYKALKAGHAVGQYVLGLLRKFYSALLYYKWMESKNHFSPLLNLLINLNYDNVT